MKEYQIIHKSKAFFYRYAVQFCLLIFFSLFVLSDIIWLKRNSLDPHWDMGRHLWNSLYYSNLIKNDYLQNFYFGWTRTYKYYPPFVYFITGILYHVTQKFSQSVAVFSELFFLAILIPFTYLVARNYLSKIASIGCTVFLITTPIVFTQFHEYMLDIPSLSLYVASLYFLLRSNHFTSRLYSILFGLLFSLSLMTKWTFALIVISPLLWEGYYIVKEGIRCIKSKEYPNVKAVVINIFLIFLIFLVIAFPWYINNLGGLSKDLVTNADSGKANELKLGIHWLLYYLFSFENTQLYLPYFLLFLSGFTYTIFIKKSEWKKYSFLLVSFFGSYLILTKLNNKDTRYIIPLLIYISIFAASLLDIPKKLNIKMIILSLFLICAFLQSFFVGFYGSPGQIKKTLSLDSTFYLTIYTNNGYTSGPPVSVHYPVETIVKDTINASQTESDTQNLLYVDQQNQIIQSENKPYFDNMVTFIGDDLSTFNGWEINYYLAKYNSLLAFNDHIETSTEGGYIILHFIRNPQNKLFLSQLPNGKQIIKSYILADKSYAYLIKLPIIKNDKQIISCHKLVNANLECPL